MQLQKSPFGITASGEAVDLYTLQNNSGMQVECISYGAAVRAIRLPGGADGPVDVALGYDTLADYEADPYFFGATVGRYANRIRGGAFTLHGKRIQLEQNDGPNHLHGGSGGFHRRVWRGTPTETGVSFFRFSPDGEGGYPGALSITVSYHLGEDNTLSIAYSAMAEADTIINLTNHTYFNLAGHTSGSVLQQELQLHAGFYLPADASGIPSGEVLPVTGGPFDFLAGKPLGQDIRADHPQLTQFGGYDHTFLPAQADAGNPYRQIATLRDPASGRRMEVRSDKPGIQLYTSNGTTATGKGGAGYTPHCAVCLETQHFPDSPNQGHFPSPLLRAGKSMFSLTEYKFSW